jgi:predicted CopG family antitoxin
MATTTISLTTEAYQKLTSLKEKGESFSDVIVKHYPRPLPRTCGELLDELEREFEGKRLVNPKRMQQVIEGRGRRSNRPSNNR